MGSVVWLCWLHLALHPSGFASFCIGYYLAGSVCCVSIVRCLSYSAALSVVCLNLSVGVYLICSRSSMYLCDSVLCTCLICSRSSPYLYDSMLCTCLICSSSPSVRTSLLLFVYLCSDLSAAVCICSSNFVVFLSNSHCEFERGC
ncbi:hypothetical protein Tco_0033200 [Tanacetum coccineum]